MTEQSARRRDGIATADSGRGRLSCPVCASYDVSRLFIASVGADSCVCAVCSATWEESRGSGAYRGRGAATSVVLRAD